MKSRTFFTILLTVVVSITTDAQVTIGSSEAPMLGALLQLKDQTEITGNGANATKGLGLPRVALEQFEKLEPCAETTVANMASHTGLVVYNTTNSGVFSPGTYSWDGTSWQRLNGDGYQGFGPWYEVGSNPAKASSLNTTDSYLKAKAVIGGDAPIGNAQLSVIGTTALGGDAKIDGRATIGSYETPASAAILELKTQADPNPSLGDVTSTKGGLLLPRVLLENNNSLAPFILGGGNAADKISNKGLIVYNIGGNGIEAGVKIWDGNVWMKVLSDVPPTPIISSNQLTLAGPYTTGVYPPSAHSNLPIMDFGEINPTTGEREIIITENGSYTFVIRLYGRCKSKRAPATVQSFYFYGYADGVQKDACEYPTTTSAYAHVAPIFHHFVGITIQLTMKDLVKGQKITFSSLHGDSYAFNGTSMAQYSNEAWAWDGNGDNSSVSAVRTSLVYWKL